MFYYKFHIICEIVKYTMYMYISPASMRCITIFLRMMSRLVKVFHRGAAAGAQQGDVNGAHGEATPGSRWRGLKEKENESNIVEKH